MCAEASSELRALAADFFFNCWDLGKPSDNHIRHVPRCVHNHEQGFLLERFQNLYYLKLKPYPRVVSRRWSGKDLEGRKSSLIVVPSRHVAGENEEYHENLGQDSQCPSQASNRTPPDCETRVLLLHHPYETGWSLDIHFAFYIYILWILCKERMKSVVTQSEYGEKITQKNCLYLLRQKKEHSHIRSSVCRERTMLHYTCVSALYVRFGTKNDFPCVC
jgi:hypothetical protein